MVTRIDTSFLLYVFSWEYKRQADSCHQVSLYIHPFSTKNWLSYLFKTASHSTLHGLIVLLCSLFKANRSSSLNYITHLLTYISSYLLTARYIYEHKDHFMFSCILRTKRYIHHLYYQWILKWVLSDSLNIIPIVYFNDLLAYCFLVLLWCLHQFTP